MLIKLKKEYLAIWLKRLASIDLGAEMNPIFKTVFMKVENGLLTLLRTNGRSFAVINIKESIEGFEVEDCKEPLEALVGSEKFYSIINKFSDGDIHLGAITEKDFYVEQGMFKGDWKQYPKKNFPIENALSLASRVSEIDPDKFKTINAEQFVKAINVIKYAPLRITFDPRLKNVVFDGKECWAVDHSRCHIKSTINFPEMDLVIPVESLSLASFIYLLEAEEFKCYEDEYYYFFVVGDDYFVIERSKLKAEEEKKLFMLEYNAPDCIQFNVSSKEFLEALERVGVTSDKLDKSIALTCQDNKVILESDDKHLNKSREVISVALSHDVPTKYIRWDSLAESLQSVSPLAVEVRIYQKSMAILTDEDTIILNFVEKD